MSRRGWLTGAWFKPATGEERGLPAAQAARSPGPPWRPTAAAPALDLVATVLPFECLAGRSLVCTVCVERCPQEGAIVMVAGRPRVDAGRCDGCGICAEVCPAPGGAIVLAPRPAGGRP